jgi:hypothetical protein
MLINSKLFDIPDATFAEILRTGFITYHWSSRPIRAAPHPPMSPPPGSIRAYKLRQQPVEALGALIAQGSFL